MSYLTPSIPLNNPQNMGFGVQGLWLYIKGVKSFRDSGFRKVAPLRGRKMKNENWK